MVLRPDVQSFISGKWSSTALQLLELSRPLCLFA